MHTRLYSVSETLRKVLEDSMMADSGPGGIAGFFGGANTIVSLAAPRDLFWWAVLWTRVIDTERA